ncbi:MFS transporter [Pseudarthrobacter sulfonivorans]|uniref:MFS transporter n=1 Tax=Pseudarthrobacter sulfonivorans TaxID=121292 RepID=UPI000A9BB771|nr:MFS transporter [Pseudarthrobacter sulfonivorans]
MANPNIVNDVSVPIIPKSGRKTIITGAALGSVIEYFDITMYTFLLVYFAPLFFPSTNATASTLAAVATLGVAYVVRPFGAVMWGWLGDKKGRRFVLTATVVLMGIATLGMGLLPTYETIGFAAPVLLVLLRLFQGLSAAGEGVSASTFVVESAPAHRRGTFGGIVPGSVIFGQALGALTAAGFAFSLTTEQMSEFGWRIPFLISAPLTLVVIYLRKRMEDSPEFLAIEKSHDVAPSPISEMLRFHWRPFLKLVTVTVAVNAPSFVAMAFVVGYLITTRHIPSADVYLILGIAMLCAALLALIAGSLADRYGRRPVAIFGIVGLIVTAVPILVIVRDSESLVLIAVAMIALLGFYAIPGSIVYVLMAEWFPTKVRMTGSAVGLNVGVAISGGLAPYITLQTTIWTGSDIAPAYWIVAASVAALAILLFSRETKNTLLAR